MADWDTAREMWSTSSSCAIQRYERYLKWRCDTFLTQTSQPERFTRLVTQLKWRLLAGAGQALYEIGVSDSGQLVGLSRKVSQHVYP